MVVTDLEEIRREAVGRAADNRDFRRHLRQHHVPEGPFQVLAAQVATEIDCTSCGNCCRQTIVAISTAEIRAIAEYLGTTAGEVTRLYTDPDPDDSSRRVIRHRDSACVFLDRNLCVIYEARPKPCRDFPHIDHRESSLGSRMETACRRTSICPIVFNALERYKHLVGWRR